MKKRAVWLSFDLGVTGDYEGMYAWLDEHKAKECGSSLAFLNYSFKTDLVASLTADIKAAVETNKKTRIYVIWRDDKKKTMKGRFILGGRKASPWAGYAEGGQQVEPDES